MERGASSALAPSIPSTSYSSQLCHCLIPSRSPTFAPARPPAFAKISTNPRLQLDHSCAPVVPSPRLGRFQCLRCQNAFLFPLRPGVKIDTGIASFCGTPIYISKGKAFPLLAHSNADRRTTPHAWLGQNSKEKANDEMDERSRKFFELLRDKERERMRHSEELKEKAGKQLELEFVQTIEWAKLLLKLQGKAKGTFWDPKPGHNIPFSDYLKLLQAEEVKYVEYGNAGKDVAVILPYSVNEGQLTSSTEKVQEQVKAKNGKIVFKRHKVAIMPADCGNDIWQQLHHQLIHINFINSKSIAAEIHPTLVTAVVWFMRLAVVLAAYLWLDRKLYPIYRLRDPTDRPKIQRLKLAGMDEDHLGSLGQSRARFISAEERTGVTFDDFAGQDYVKRELQEVVSILKGAAEFAGLGVYCPKGVLLYGPPGTGKTLLAKAIAGEAGVPFFSASGSEFVEMFLGVAAARVRDLFVRARQFAPSIIFIDEIDAIGAKRGGPDVGGGGVEREQGLIQILTELDGFRTSNAQVLVVGATNRLDLLDPALLRKGRFDKIISIGLPTAEGRLAILRVHAKNKGWRSDDEKEILLKELASITPDFSGAELQNVLNEASILAARRDRDIIVMEDLTEALNRQEGTFKTGQEDEVEISGEAKIRVAYREAAIAVLECYFPNRHVPFLKTTIRFLDTSPNITYKEPRGALFSKKRDITNSIVRACASRVVEEQIFGKENVSWISGASLEEAGVMADYLILQTGMTALGKLHYETKQDVVTHLGRKVQALRDEYMRYSLEKCAAILKEYRSALETIADALMEKLDIEADEIWDIFNKAPRIPQSEPVPVDEYAALLYSGRWGIHGVSLPGRVTFKPGNTGFATYGAPRTMHTRVIHEDAWKAMDALFEKQAEELKQESLQNKIPEVVSSGQFF